MKESVEHEKKKRIEINPAKTGVIVFAISFFAGLVIFVGFGQLAGVFSPGKKIIDVFTGSPAGWASLFGATLMLGSPIIGLTLWAIDIAVKRTLDKAIDDKSKN